MNTPRSKLPPMPKMPRMPSASRPRVTGKPGKAKGKKILPDDLDRTVQWRHEVRRDRLDHVYGTCARCHQRKLAVDLRWSPDRMMFGEFHQGFWACRYGCDDTDTE